MAGLDLRVSLAHGPVWIAHLAAGAGSSQFVICGEVFGRFRDQDGFRDGVFLDASLWRDLAAGISARMSVVAEAGGMRVLALIGLNRAGFAGASNF